MLIKLQLKIAWSMKYEWYVQYFQLKFHSINWKLSALLKGATNPYLPEIFKVCKISSAVIYIKAELLTQTPVNSTTESAWKSLDGG